MSAEIIKLANTLNQEDINIQIAMQCAPLIMGVKLSNLLSTECKNERKVVRMFRDTSICVHTLYKCNNRITFLLYQKDRLYRYISGEMEREFLYRLGYERITLSTILNRITTQFTNYMEKREPFPHELGLLLEYPVGDVIGFMENEGKNSLYTGYWKVYSNLQEALNIFEQYDAAKSKVIQMVSHGMSVCCILDAYYKNTNRIAM